MCRVPGCTSMFKEEIQRSLHEATTWHCIVCGFSDGSDLMRIQTLDELECRLCNFNRIWQSKVDSTCTIFIVDFKNKRHKRLTKNVE